jgi:hypothetical protein
MKAGGTTKRPFVLHMDGGVFYYHGVRLLAVVSKPTDSEGESLCSISISFVNSPT